MRITLPVLLLLPVLAVATAGCATVRPWERERLSHPCMLVQPQLGDGYRAHLLPIREGAVDSAGAIGAGCGCN
ncbi:MAG: DUF4266 domain-containing protein [Deltaproteobacteria bacterium]|nr:DUF4266 domain-containing protein [Deltaproteobacteria bacterium]